MKVSRPYVVIGAVVIVAGMVAGLTLWAVADDSPTAAVDEALLLQSDELPPAYLIDGVDRYTGTERPVDVAPDNCRQVLMDEYRRNEKAQSVRISVVSRAPGSAEYTQTVTVDGQGVNDVVASVKTCPQYTQSTDNGRLAVSQWIVPEPADCNARVTYMRFTLTRESPGTEPERSESIAAYMQRGSTVSSVYRLGPGEPDANFCDLVGRANERLNGIRR